MAHKGLSPDAVVKAAVELIEQQGRDAFFHAASGRSAGDKNSISL